jgi:hypothetical protein
MNRECRVKFVDESHQTQILDNDGIDASRGEPVHQIDNDRQFIGKDQRVEGDVAPNIVMMQELRDGGKFVRVEIRRPVSSVEFTQAEIDSVRPVRHGRPETVPVACRSQQFGSMDL